MRSLLVFMLCSLSCLMFGITRTVSLDGTHQYTSIQVAIDACTNGDVISVYPGEYYENLNTNGHSITIQSQYPTTQSDQTINTTIIHGNNTNSCLLAENGETIILNGFKLMNNDPVDLAVNFYNVFTYGNGIQITNSSAQVLNCIITNCIARTAGALFFSGYNSYFRRFPGFFSIVMDSIPNKKNWGYSDECLIQYNKL